MTFLVPSGFKFRMGLLEPQNFINANPLNVLDFIAPFGGRLLNFLHHTLGDIRLNARVIDANAISGPKRRFPA